MKEIKYKPINPIGKRENKLPSNINQIVEKIILNEGQFDIGLALIYDGSIDALIKIKNRGFIDIDQVTNLLPDKKTSLVFYGRCCEARLVQPEFDKLFLTKLGYKVIDNYNK